MVKKPPPPPPPPIKIKKEQKGSPYNETNCSAFTEGVRVGERLTHDHPPPPPLRATILVAGQLGIRC